jgi:AcrR family transcriptional regulator
VTTSPSIGDFRHGRVPRELRERQLVELAEQLFAERGYGGTSMEELASRAGVTKPMVYELFGSKDGVFRACVDRAVGQMARSVAEAVRAEAEPEAHVRAGGLAFLRFAADNRGAWDLMSMGGQFAQQAVDIRRGQAELIHELMLELAPEGVDERELEAAAWAVTAAYEGLAHWMWEHPDVAVEEAGDWIVALLMPGLRRFT